MRVPPDRTHCFILSVLPLFIALPHKLGKIMSVYLDKSARPKSLVSIFVIRIL